jgi:hypothetical protein
MGHRGRFTLGQTTALRVVVQERLDVARREGGEGTGAGDQVTAEAERAGDVLRHQGCGLGGAGGVRRWGAPVGWCAVTCRGQEPGWNTVRVATWAPAWVMVFGRCPAVLVSRGRRR